MDARRRGATIADVAARAGVALSTVSRVLNDGQVSERTRARVLSVMSELDYRPVAAARALASGATGAVGIVIPYFTTPSSVERLRGAVEAMRASARELVLCDVAGPEQRDAYLGPRAPLDRVDGLLIVSLAPRDAEVEAITRSGVPAVLVDAYHAALPRIVTNDIRGGELATRHLIELGHERIGFIGDSNDPRLGFVSSQQRWSGYRQALAEAGITLEPSLRRLGPHGRATALRQTKELLSLRRPPTAVFAVSDTQALGVLEAAANEGVAVPDELSVVGYDDLEVAHYVGLTTVHQPLRESGRRGVERLLDLLGGHTGGPLEELLPIHLQARRTTAPA